MDKVIRDDLVAVIYTPDYGTGWYSWHETLELLYDPSIVGWIETGESNKIRVYMGLKYGDTFIGDVDRLRVMWIPSGERFRIEEYDGAEAVILERNQIWFTA
jgi:hypothetical protein